MMDNNHYAFDAFVRVRGGGVRFSFISPLRNWTGGWQSARYIRHAIVLLWSRFWFLWLNYCIYLIPHNWRSISCIRVMLLICTKLSVDSKHHRGFKFQFRGRHSLNRNADVIRKHYVYRNIIADTYTVYLDSIDLAMNISLKD